MTCARYIEYISQFSTNIAHISGESNVVAGSLSRPEVAQVSVESVVSDGGVSVEKNSSTSTERQRS